MPYENSVSLYQLDGGPYPNIAAKLWNLWVDTAGHRQMETESITVQLSSNNFNISFNGEPGYSEQFEARGLSIQNAASGNRPGVNDGYWFRSGSFYNKPLPQESIEIIVKIQEIPPEQLPSLLPPVPMEVDAGTVITEVTASLTTDGIDFTALGNTNKVGPIINFRFTGKLIMAPSTDISMAGSEALSVGIDNPEIVFIGGSGIPSAIMAEVLNLLRLFIMHDYGPEIRKRLEQQVNAGILSYIAGLATMQELPIGVTLSIAAIHINTERIFIEGALGAFGGIRSKFPVPSEPNTIPSNCFIATAAYGSALAPEVNFLRNFRDEVLRKTRIGAKYYDRFYEQYYRISPPIADLMSKDQNLKDVIRWSLVTPLINYCQIAMNFPNQNLDTVPEPWHSFLTEIRNGLEEWAKIIELPYDFSNITNLEATEEICIVMKYLLRQPKACSAYLNRLQELAQLPLRHNNAETLQIMELLQSFGCSEVEIKKILG